MIHNAGKNYGYKVATKVMLSLEVTTTRGTGLKAYCTGKVEKHCSTAVHECASFFPAQGPPSSHGVPAGLLLPHLTFTICSVALLFLMQAVTI